MRRRTSYAHSRRVGRSADTTQEDDMQLYPSTALDAEVAYRRERIAEQFRGSGGRSHRAGGGLARRLPRHRRADRDAA